MRKANSLTLHSQHEKPHCKVDDGHDHEGQADRDGGVPSKPSQFMFNPLSVTVAS
jgi:hypothetical protein